MLREAVFLFLRKYQLPVRHDFKDPALGFDQSRLHSRFLLDRFCQTGSLGIVVSIIAVFDRNALDHGFSFLRVFQPILAFPGGPFNRRCPGDPKRKLFSLSTLCISPAFNDGSLISSRQGFPLIPVVPGSNSGKDVVFESQVTDEGAGAKIVFPLLQGHIFS